MSLVAELTIPGAPVVGRPAEVPDVPGMPVEGPLRVDATFMIALHAGLTRAEQERCVRGLVRPREARTMDLLRALLDGLVGVGCYDEGNVAELAARQLYSREPRTVLRLFAL